MNQPATTDRKKGTRMKEEDFGRRPMSPSEARQDLLLEISNWNETQVIQRERENLELKIGTHFLAYLKISPEGYLTAILEVPMNLPESLSAVAELHAFRRQGDLQWIALPMRTVSEVAHTILFLDFRRSMFEEPNKRSPLI